MRFQNFTLSAPNRITARELCELNEDGASLMASSIRAVVSACDSGRFLPSTYWLRRLRDASMKALLMGSPVVAMEGAAACDRAGRCL